MPGAQAGAQVTEQRVYPRLQSFILHALMQVGSVSSSTRPHLSPVPCTPSDSRRRIIRCGVDAVCTIRRRLCNGTLCKCGGVHG